LPSFPNSRRYQLLPQGYSICLVLLKLFERVYALLTAGLVSPIKADARLQTQTRSQLDRLYRGGGFEAKAGDPELGSRPPTLIFIVYTPRA
jgi:hypothetical protein